LRRRKLFVANWKMNGTTSFAEAYATFFLTHRSSVPPYAEVVFCPPTLYISTLRGIAESGCAFLGVQNVATEKQGAFTGEVSAMMAAESGCQYGIVGHSERRRFYQESESDIRAKILRLEEAGLIPILCVGETEEQRAAGQMREVLAQQLKDVASSASRLVVAYEPIWAIGTGKTPTPAEIGQTHQEMRALLQAQGCSTPTLLYGGSVTAANARDFLVLDEVDGVLVGGASLQETEFLAIIRCLEG
jgi:triosephosphate isomerase